jgi:hypothetical protein
MRDFFLILIDPIFCCGKRRPARKLHLKVYPRSHPMTPINIGDTNTARIAPDGDGVLTNVQYAASGGYGPPVVAPDGLSAVFTAVAPGTGFTVTVTAQNDAVPPVTLTDTASLSDVNTPTVPATRLNLSVTQP